MFEPAPDRHIPIREGVTPGDFAAEARPVVLKGVATDWPAVVKARQGNRALADYLRGFDRGRPAQVWLGEPAIGGRFFYGDSLDKLNFRKAPATVTATVEHLLGLADATDPPSVYIQSQPVDDLLPGFAAANRLDLVPDGVTPRLWIGNRLRVQTHYDPVDNIACVVAGRRRFTLFAPHQTANLYVGPLDKTVAGAPVSMAAIEESDFERFPRLEAALAEAVYADLEPGDAIYIPYMWWHHVQSLTAFNMLVNYWWDNQPGQNAEAMDAFLHAILAMKGASPARRDIWRAMFEHYAFQTHGDPVAHLDDADKGALGEMTDADRAQMRQHLLTRLAMRWQP